MPVCASPCQSAPPASPARPRPSAPKPHTSHHHQNHNPQRTKPINTPHQRNNIPLLTTLDGETISNFKLREFENRDGLAMIHRKTLTALELTRRDLNNRYGETVWVLITSAVRTQEDQQRLAARLGWTDEGGLVARRSRHLPQFGGIAVDIIAVRARTRTRIPQQLLGEICRQHFDYVKDDYSDGHVHADNRNSANTP